MSVPPPAETGRLLDPFPVPGPLVQLAQWELHLAVNGTPEQQKALGNHADLPRPWDPATCRGPRLRAQLWDWLDRVVIWLNHDYTWDPDPLIPSCWPLHPHLVHEIAVLADQRRRAGLAKTSDALEEWHRYSLPAFSDRLHARLRSHCEAHHQPWPGRPRHLEHLDPDHAQARAAAFHADAALGARRSRQENRARRAQLGLVDLETGEILSEPTPAPDPRTRTEKGPRS